MIPMEELLASLHETDEDRSRARRDAFLMAGATLLQHSARGQEANAVGRAMEAFTNTRRSGEQEARDRRFRDLQLRGLAYDVAGREAAFGDAELLRKQQQDFAQRFGATGGDSAFTPLPNPWATGQGGGMPPPTAQAAPGAFPRGGTVSDAFAMPPASPAAAGAVGGSAPPPDVSAFAQQMAGAPQAMPPSGPPGAPPVFDPSKLVSSLYRSIVPGGMPSPRERALRYQQQSEFWANLGRMDQAKVYADAAQRVMPKVKEQRTVTQNGQRVLLNLYEDGSTELLPDVQPDLEKAHFLDTGANIGAVDPFTGQPVAGGALYNKTLSPAEQDASRRGWANQGLEERKFGYQQRKDAAEGGGKPPPGYRWTNGGQALEAIPGGPNDTRPKDEQRAAAATARADTVLGKVDEAMRGINVLSAGSTGAVLGRVPGTDAYDLRATVDTIKANLGFDELQKMREASPTGGALGGIAVQELHMLQSTVASLDTNQSAKQLKRNLAKVRQHYENWRAAVNKANGAGAESTPAPRTGPYSLDSLEQEVRRRGLQ